MSQASEAVEAFVFRKVRDHLKVNTGVQNIDVMNTAGFCRNCLSKWYFVGAQQMGIDVSYDEACEIVYGMPYAEWKKEYQTKATKEQMEQFQRMKNLHADHPDFVAPGKDKGAATKSKPIIRSDVCCDVGKGDKCAADMVARISRNTVVQGVKRARIRLGVLTVSDRASKGVYDDESGPEIKQCFTAYASKVESFLVDAPVEYKLVADEKNEIEQALISLSEKCNVIITTGGTGCAKRDVTPEATMAVVDRELRGIPEAIRRETSKIEPLAILSRAVAGIRKSSCLIVNLPGRPKACRESMAVLLPILNQTVNEMNN
mmetsp:Transcript_13385/g.23977  ORF Transcript_13385/g.23977 Transcript_13385/m.23977 type:complete len:317 (-) Transcript_13385:1592-2542(-)